MPKIMVPIPEVDDMVMRPVIFDIVRQLMKHTHIPRDLRILFPSAEEVVAIPKTTLEQINTNAEHVQFDNGGDIQITVTETIQEDSVLTRAVLTPEHIPFLIDQVLGIIIKPVYVHTETELAFTNEFDSKTEAEKWLNEMKNKIAMMRDTILHKATYAYTIPNACLNIVKEIHRLREKQGGYGDTFESYLEQVFSPNVTVITNVGGKVHRYGVRETQQRILGQFDFREEPEKGSKKNNTDSWVISFNYKFEYDKPVAVAMDYPLMIHNQLLSQDYRPSKEDRGNLPLENMQRRYAQSLYAISHFESDNDAIRFSRNTKGIGIPDFDEFVPAEVVDNTWRLVTWMIQLTEKDTLDLVNIKDLPKTKGMVKVLHDFLLSEAVWLNKPLASIFQLTLYEDAYPLPSEMSRVDSRYNFVATRNLDIRKTYHVRLSVVHDWSKLTEEAKTRLRKAPDAIQELIKGLFPSTYKRIIDEAKGKAIGRGEWPFKRFVDDLVNSDQEKYIRDKWFWKVFDDYVRRTGEYPFSYMPDYPFEQYSNPTNNETLKGKDRLNDGKGIITKDGFNKIIKYIENTKYMEEKGMMKTVQTLWLDVKRKEDDKETVVSEHHW